MNKRKKLKVLLVSPYSASKVGGIGTWTKNLIDYILDQPQVDLEFQNTAFLLKKNIDQGKYRRLLWGTIDSLLIIFRVFYNIIRIRPDTIHYTSSASFALFKDYIIAVICLIFGVKFVVHFHFGRIPELSKQNNWEWKWIVRVTNISNIVIVIDNASYQVMRSSECRDKIFYIPNPVSTEVYDLAKSVSNVKELNMRIVGKVVFAGHVVPAKGIFELVHACTNLSDVTQLVICGSYCEETRVELEEIAKKREGGKWLVFKGEVKREDVINELKGSLIFCLPSYTEGFPNAVMEAMAMSCAVVATGVGAIPEMLDFKTPIAAGIELKIRDVYSLCLSLKQLINDRSLAIKLGENGNRKILNEYNLNVIVPKYYEIWK